MDPVTAVAPGKIIVAGEHAVVYQRPALVAAIDRWLRVTVAPRTEPGVALHLHDLDHRAVTDAASIRDYADTVRARWHAYADDPTPHTVARMQGDDPAHLVKVALGEAMRHLGADTAPPMTVTVQSQQPVGGGFGSSAAVAVAVVQAYLAARGATVDDDTLYDLALNVERRQHGTPSGVDPATVLRGGLVWAEGTSDGLTFESVTARSPVLDAIRIVDTGTPHESTGTVVDAVRARRASDPAAFEATLDRIEHATRRLRTVLAAADPKPDATVQLLREAEAGLEALGVVPEPVQEIVRTVDDHGGAAKISGAGALSGSNAGSLLVYHPNPDAAAWNAVDSLTNVRATLGARGAHVEEGLPSSTISSS